MGDTSYSKPLPQPDPVTQPFWDSVNAHAMKIQHCGPCGRFVFYPRTHCPYCFARDLEWRSVVGQGTVHAFTIVHYPSVPSFRVDAPYVVALIELKEGVRMMSTLVGLPPDENHVHVGMSVRVVYDDVAPETTLPKFRPIQDDEEIG